MRILLLLWLVLILAHTNPFSIGTVLVSGQCLSDQKSLLLEFKNSLDFNASLSTKLIKWNQSNDSWDGVTCEGGQVTGLDLSKEGITSGLSNSSSLFRFNYLRMLNLAFNNFQSLEIPSGLGNLTNLVHLNLSNAGFAGQVPIGMSHLTRLVTLDVSLLYFPGLTSLKLENPNLKMLVGNLSELRELYLDGANVSATGNEWCNALSSSLPKLQVLSMMNCNLSGPIESCSSLVNLPFLSVIKLGNNNLSTTVPEFFARFHNLTTLHLSNCGLQGQFPQKIFRVQTLQTLDLSFNQLLQGSLPEFPENGSLQTLVLSFTNISGGLPYSIGTLRNLSRIELQLRNLSYLDLSYNRFSINATASQASSFPDLGTLKLVSCQLRTLPEFLAGQHRLVFLDLSDNQIEGKIPKWIWKLQDLLYLNLSSNLLDDIETLPRNLTSTLFVLDLHKNRLRGQTLPLPPFAAHMDFSSNNFTLVIPLAIGTSLSTAIVFSLSNNNFQGFIPESICEAGYLEVLDLSHNNLTGSIPDCLVMESLKNVGNNQIDDVFPCQLKSISSLRVLVLRSNKFYGGVGCPETNGTWKMLQIVDISSNNFSGTLRAEWLTSWEAMKANVDFNYIHYPILLNSGLYYQDTISVTIKGLQMELVKILTVFTSIDVSCNNLEGPIPETLGDLKALYVLNISKNAFSGPIPSFLGHLQQLESLDLSWNHLNGTIPTQLTDLNFLSFLNLSYNKLVGCIPAIKQFLTFSASSFEGNAGLCGPQLGTYCSSSIGGNLGSCKIMHEKTCSIATNGTENAGCVPTQSDIDDDGENDDSEKKWFYMGIPLGFVVGFWVFCCPLLFIKSWRFAYYRFWDKVLFRHSRP
ncbi:receptor-like protein 35 [Syzygium oleosum]|uniref:receptor-like protein 35 n=1 Tax=Syzygium oleosum TaxID=219896 RepID=UPI0024BA50E4|nr:receptor-like protein 35 [Syzygium oleosum]